MPLNYNHLHSFHVVASEGSVTGAAKKLGVSQPALSAQIKQLEERLGVRLFARVGNRLELTQSGALLYQHSTRLFALGDQMLKELAAQREQKQGVIRIGVADGVERPFAVGLIGHLIEREGRKPRPRIQMVAGSHDVLLKQARSRELDFLLTDREAGELDSLGRLSMPVVLAVKTDRAPQGTRRPRTVEQLLAELERNESGIILPAPHLRIRQDTECFLSRNSLRVRTILEVDQMASLVRGVVEGIGAALLPYPYIQRVTAPTALFTFGLPEGLWQHPLRILYAGDGFVQPYLAEMRDALRKFASRGPCGELAIA